MKVSNSAFFLTTLWLVSSLSACQPSRKQASAPPSVRRDAAQQGASTTEADPQPASTPDKGPRQERGKALALPHEMASLKERWQTPGWLIAYDASRALAMRREDASSSPPTTLYDRAAALEACLRKEGAAFMIEEKGMQPEQVYAMKAAPVAVVGDLITIEKFESSMCEGGAHPMNAFSFETLKLSSEREVQRMTLGQVFRDREALREAFDGDPLLSHLARYHKRYHAAPREGAFEELSPCLYEVRIPEPWTITSWTFDKLEAGADKVHVSLLFSNPVHACAGQPVRHVIALPLPEALARDLTQASDSKTLYSQSDKGGVEP